MAPMPAWLQCLLLLCTYALHSWHMVQSAGMVPVNISWSRPHHGTMWVERNSHHPDHLSLTHAAPMLSSVVSFPIQSHPAPV